MQCPKCQHENPKEALFCMKCGTKQQRKCQNCGAEYPNEALFCMKCGTKLAEAAPTPTKVAVPKLEDVHAQLQRSMPKSLAEKFQSVTSDLEGENRILSILFGDISGSVPLTENMSPEDAADLINECLKVMVDAILKYEGSINRYIGDCVLAFFGAPVAHENDPERAILAALEMRDAVTRLNLNIKIGINTGMVYVGAIGPDAHREFAAMGSTVNLASRLQGAAQQPGQILVGESTYRLTRRSFEFQPMPPLTLKGIDKPVSAYEVLKVKEHPEKVRGIEGLQARMIGREREFADLLECADALKTERKGQIVTIVGEAGIGKSRLVKELKEYLKDKGVQWLEGRCISIGQSASFWPFIDMMRTYLGISGEDTEKDIGDKLIQQMTALFGQEAEGIIPYVGQMLSIKLPEQYQQRLRYAVPEQIRRQILLRMRDVFVTLARKQPLILILEDMHWADDLSLDLLWVLMDELVAAPILLVCVYRLEREHRSWQIDSVASSKYLERYTHISLKPLTSQQSQQMIKSLLTIENIPFETKAAILEKTEGNPFFVEEVIRLLIERGVIYQEGERWKAKEAIDEMVVPDTIQSVILSRIDRLHEEVKYVLQCASMIGRVFQHRLLGYLSGKENILEERLSELEANELVYKERIVPELEYAFKHALTQETTYQGILNRQRRLFHARVGEGIETLYQEQIEEYYERLAYHYSLSDKVEKAIEYLVKAGQKAANRYANKGALDYFQQALERVETGEDYDRILGYRAKLLLSLFRGKEAASDYERLLQNAKSSGNRKDELESLLGLASAYYIIALDAQESGSASRCRELYKEAYTLARDLDDKACMVRALIPTRWFIDFWLEYREQATANVEEALILSQEIGDEELIIDSKMAMFGYPEPLVVDMQGEELLKLLNPLESRHDLVRLKELYFSLMWEQRFVGNFERCVECCDAGIRLAAEIGVLPVQYPTLKAFALLDLGSYDAAWKSLQKEVADEEHPFGSAFKDFGTGIYFLQLMAYKKAVETFESVIEQARRLGRAWIVRWAKIQLAKSLARAGQLNEASLDRITQDIASIGGTLPADVIAEIALSAGRLDEAFIAAEKARSQAEENGYRPDQISALELQLRVLLRLDSPKDVIALADAGIRMAEEISYLPMVWRIRAAKARALEMLDDTEAAVQEYGAAAAIIRKLADNIPDAELKHGFMSNPLVSSIIDASLRGFRSNHDAQEVVAVL